MATEGFARNAREGFSLVETLVGLVIIAFILLGLAMYMQTVLGVRKENLLRDEAVSYLRSCASALRTSDLCLDNCTIQDDYVICQIPASSGSTTFLLKYPKNFSSGINHLRLEVSYVWRGGNHTYVMEVSIYRP